MKKYSIENLIIVHKHILEFFKDNEELNREYIITEIPLETLKSIFCAEKNDDELYLSYTVNESQAEKINGHLKTKISFDFEKFEYYFQQYGEYKE
ncbi:hypothetical protein IVB69_01490 [Flavobacterium sp. J49]|uniref:DUF7683 domain-containing protein n=1 Tax=Flavobacterium sp. J49 TaxID=2718534 RepID=UPI001593465C|nr:hypothetical protein [Flavobacterium sp. J49]MBF6640143.1 hypothetical protein [Flavobacterium sp. J49]NIC01388.1 hypothetical protein [Flavobacterium sp. J49]